jgi:ferritin
VTCNNIGAMKLNDTLAKAYSDQITLELESSVAYLQLAIVAEDLDLPGIASWFRLQADEEREHADKFIAHVTARGNRPQIGSISSPADPGDSVVAAFEASLAHEQKVSESIRDLYRLAQAEGDIDSIPLLHWFIEEQIEEESTVEEILGRLRLIGKDGTGLLRLDAELGVRTPGD